MFKFQISIEELKAVESNHSVNVVKNELTVAGICTKILGVTNKSLTVQVNDMIQMVTIKRILGGSLSI